MKEYYTFVIDQFFSDTITLLDKVLSDDESDPEYSAVMAYNRLYAYLKLTADPMDLVEENQICELLFESGYSDKDIRRFLALKNAEEPNYRGILLYVDG